MRRVVAGVLLAAACSRRRRELVGALVRACLSRRSRGSELAFARAIVATDRASLVLQALKLRLLWFEFREEVDRRRCPAAGDRSGDEAVVPVGRNGSGGGGA